MKTQNKVKIIFKKNHYYLKISRMLNLFGEDLSQDKTKKKHVDVFNDYDGFVDKFKPKKTTDDCYTPAPVYDRIKKWVSDNLLPLEGVEIVRPFYPGGDYERHPYPEGCLVLDNPPFSILAKIRRFYHARGIRYFLFGPALTLASSAKELTRDTTYIICKESITYENGATVATSFITNLDCGGVGLWVSGSLTKAIKEGNSIYQEDKRIELPVYEYPDCVCSPAILRRMAVPGIEYKVGRSDMISLSALDSQREMGKGIFGGGWLISERAAAERAATRKKKYWTLSEKEKDIQSKLG